MTLTPGTRLGPYEILAAIGAGGMGEVYRARDTKLDRDVAIKILPDRVRRRPRAARPLHARSADAGLAQSSPHRADLRARRTVGRASQRARDGAGRGPDAGGRHRAADRLPLDEALPIATADRRGARGGARAGHHPPRPQARQHQGHGRRHGEGAGLRAGQGTRPGSARARRPVPRTRRPSPVRRDDAARA